MYAVKITLKNLSNKKKQLLWDILIVCVFIPVAWAEKIFFKTEFNKRMRKCLVLTNHDFRTNNTILKGSTAINKQFLLNSAESPYNTIVII